MGTAGLNIFEDCSNIKFGNQAEVGFSRCKCHSERPSGAIAKHRAVSPWGKNLLLERVILSDHRERRISSDMVCYPEGRDSSLRSEGPFQGGYLALRLRTANPTWLSTDI